MSNDSDASIPTRYRPSTMSKKQIAIRFFTYGVMTIVTIVGVAVCIAWTMGYRFDIMSGQFSQVTLLQLNSFPTGASIDINDVRISSRTTTRHNIKSGRTKVAMTLDGYQPWSKVVNARAGNIRWLDYIRLIPRGIKTDSIHAFSGVDDMVASPDRKWAVLLLDSKQNNFSLMDVQDPKNPKWIDFSLNADVLTVNQDNPNSQQFEVVEWNSDSRYILIKHSYGDNSEYLIYDRVDKLTRNINKDFGIALESPHFVGAGGDLIVGLTGSDLRKIDYGNKSISAPIASGVISYSIYNNQLAFISELEKNNKKEWSVSIYDGKVTEIKRYNSGSIKAAFTKTNDTDYLIIAHNQTVAVIPDPLHLVKQSESRVDQNTAYLSSPSTIEWLMTSDNGRFVMFGNNNKITSYDIEEGETFSFETSLNGQPKWLDNYHLFDQDHNSISFVEFDGQNRQTIVSGHLPAFLSNNGKYLYSLDNIAGGTVIQRSQMVIKD